MEIIKKIEAYVAPWYKNLPHLPLNFKKWLADNIWWLVIIFVVIGTLGMLMLLYTIFIGGLLLAGLGGPFGAALGGLALLATLITMALALATLVISYLAINPLKDKQKTGWLLLFTILLINVVSGVLAVMVAFDVFSLIRELLVAAIGGYFLFEIREYYGAQGEDVDTRHTPGFASPVKKGRVDN